MQTGFYLSLLTIKSSVLSSILEVFQVWSMDPWGSPYPIRKGDSLSKKYSHDNTNILLSYSSVVTFALMMQKQS